MTTRAGKRGEELAIGQPNKTGIAVGVSVVL
jgi:hypothetical protein